MTAKRKVSIRYSVACYRVVHSREEQFPLFGKEGRGEILW
jgi:hypothetical protein